jgi:hypothetical protein
VYKANFKPSQVACPFTWNFVYLTDEVRNKIKQSKMPRLAPEEVKPAFEEVAHKAALEKGMRAQLNLSNGSTLGFMQMNRTGQ